jgi:hypothetical protein
MAAAAFLALAHCSAGIAAIARSTQAFLMIIGLEGQQMDIAHCTRGVFVEEWGENKVIVLTIALILAEFF